MKKLLVVVDMQHDFIGGSLGSKEAVAIVPEVVKKIKAYEDAGDEVVFTMDTHQEDYLETLEGKNLPVMHCVKGTSGWELHPELLNVGGQRFEKDTFGSIGLMHYVCTQTYESVELVGLCTDICIISNAFLLKTGLPQVPVWVDSTCCAGVTPERHHNALEAMRACQINIK